MASVLFSTIGQAIGGPLGAGIGAALGAGLDASLFRRRRRGAQDGFASRSAYGEVVPHIFGRNRVGGLLIWAAGPDGGGGKGQGRRAQATSFAMAISRGPVRSVGRIWADGSLLRRADGTFLTAARMRLHSRGQSEPDPLIVAAEGADEAPSYAALSYVVFEDLDLAPFGNRIPSLSFEVVADEGRPQDWLGEVAAQVGVGVRLGDGQALADGYAAYFDPFPDDVEPLLGMAAARIGLQDGRLAFVGEPRVFELLWTDLLNDPADPDSEGSIGLGERPLGVALSYQDSDRDYQLGWQEELRSGKGRPVTASWGMAAEAAVARGLALRLLREADAGSQSVRIWLPPRFMGVNVGDSVRLEDGSSWLVTRREVRGLSVLIEGRGQPEGGAAEQVPTDAGRDLPSNDQLPAMTVAALVEPPVPLIPGSGPTLLLAASGGPGWRGVDVQLLQAGEERSVGQLSEQVPFGLLSVDLPWSPETIWDERHTLLVETGGGIGSFQSRAVRDVLDGAGLLSVGGELVQYRRADEIADGLIRLSGLLRGRFGTAVPGLVTPAGTLVMTVPRRYVAVDLATEPVGRELTMLLVGHGEPVGGAELRHQVSGAGQAPLAPVHVRGERSPDGAVACVWVPRSRDGWTWEQTGAAEIGSYIWHFLGVDGVARTLAAGPTGIVVTAALQWERFGGLLPPGSFRVEAMGEGPAVVRTSRLVQI